MANDVALLEKQLAPMAPEFQKVLAGTIPVERLIRTVVISAERLPKLLECNRQSLFTAAMSAAVLGLEVDGVTGQAFLIPFAGKAQLVIGYKGYNTIAARSGITITGGIVREGDGFEFDEARGFITHKRVLGGESKRRIIAAWAKAEAKDRPAIIKVLSIDEIEDIKRKSPGAKKPDSPWNDPSVGFPAMAEKSAKRRLARSLPLNVFQWAARMEEAFEEQGKGGFIDPERGPVIEGEGSPFPAAEAQETPAARAITRREDIVDGETVEETKPKEQPIPEWGDYVNTWNGLLDDNNATANALGEAWNNQKEIRNRIEWPDKASRIALGERVAAEIKKRRVS